MPSPVFHRLRRCRALFALALCAWMAMGSAAWARIDCCASMAMQGTMAMHGDSHASPPHGQHHADQGECTCAHMTADLPEARFMAMLAPAPHGAGWPARLQRAPQPVEAPPLRPPAA
ncbi:hypothetical protein ASG87_03240 [Frateuria sp. Soil773]|uniref:hypothetical protein n=1 Tax=Frateuria sp. Soil773 TaxID=1736407 RepID=UPI0006FCCF34|nr:hypothetical protein [Frateuria sp. Soil773]KRE89368.1 hypothetical protein ASG87_03240 [Frateuria sp. Soil773]